MQFPALDDTIVAVATGWQPAPIGIIRLSGPAAVRIVGSACGPLPEPEWELPAARSVRIRARLTVPRDPATESIDDHSDVRVTAQVLIFRAPRSYTGQEVVEIHLPGAPPLLRAICDAFMAHGARRALPGEFTARAFLNHKLNADQVAAVADILSAADAAATRAAARTLLLSQQALTESVIAGLEDLLARVEAGIDFVEEEDVVFISGSELAERLRHIQQQLNRDRQVAESAAAAAERAGRPCVTLVGLPNAGKSTLFNALVGADRAIVSPVVGTTRDVISAEIELSGIRIVLQDSAGLGASPAGLDQASYVATDQAASRADFVLWVHAAATAWNPEEINVLSRITADRRLIVLSKSDLPGGDAHSRPPGDWVPVSASTGKGLEELRVAIGRQLARRTEAGAKGISDQNWEVVTTALNRTARLADADESLRGAELVAFELRTALGAVTEMGYALADEVLGRIFNTFCIGK